MACVVSHAAIGPNGFLPFQFTFKNGAGIAVAGFCWAALMRDESAADCTADALAACCVPSLGRIGARCGDHRDMAAVKATQSLR